MDASDILEAALSKWTELQPFTFPPSTFIKLWEHQGGRIVVDNRFAPPVGYAGYQRTKGRPEVIDQLPEVQGWPELGQGLKTINDINTAVETMGCGVDISDATAGAAKACVASYTDVIFSNLERRLSVTDYLRLASHIVSAIDNWALYWAQVSMGLEQIRPANNEAPIHWALEFHITNHGRTADEARRGWGDVWSHVAAAAASYR